MKKIESNRFLRQSHQGEPQSDYGRYCRSSLTQLLHAVGLDAVYERAEGDYLWQRRGDDLFKVLDLVGGYGANLFGHFHPELKEEYKRLLDAQAPVMAQGSCRAGAARLAGELCRKLGDYVVIFTNSGSETIEAALKHAYLERRRPVFWAVKNAFHGKTTGALQLTWSHRDRFDALGPEVRAIDAFDCTTWEAHEREADQVSAVVLEPILGEGGIRLLPRSFIDWITTICEKKDIPVIVDEIQTGFGRTGSFLASEWLGIEPDYLCLAKSMGGGLAKIGALMIRRSRFIEDFAIEHTSTFAEDDLSCYMSLKALEILERDALPERCLTLGRDLIADLEKLQKRFPDVIREIRGRGLMIGIEFQDQTGSPSNAFDVISRQGFFGFVAAGYLLNVHGIRIAPTLSQPFTLRVEPSAYIARAALDRFLDALEEFCEAARALDIVHITGYLVDHPAGAVVDYNQPRPYKREPAESPHKVAFITHLVLPEHLTLWDPAFGNLPADRINAYMSRAMRPFSPAIFDQIHVTSRTGQIVHLSSVCLYMTSETIMDAWKKGDARWLREQVEKAVSTARDQHCMLIGLGGYSSIVTGNGLRVKTKGIGLTTGNSLTVGMGILACKEAARREGIELAASRLGVVGASGNIAQMYAMLMAAEVGGLVLIVQERSVKKVESLIEAIQSKYPELPFMVTDSLHELQSCAIIVSASNDPQPLIFPEHLSKDPVVICDIALPADVDESVGVERPGAVVINGGVVRLPEGNEDFRISGLALGPGHVYACIAETLLLGLEGMSSGSRGAIKPESVQQMLQLADKHGFTLGKLKTERLAN